MKHFMSSSICRLILCILYCFKIVESETGQMSKGISTSKHIAPVQPELSQFPLRIGRRFTTQLCFACRHFGGASTSKGDRQGQRVFIDRGFSCWKNIQRQLRQHNNSKWHGMSWAAFKAVRTGQKSSIAAVTASNQSEEVQQNRVHLKINA